MRVLEDLRRLATSAAEAAGAKLTAPPVYNMTDNTVTFTTEHGSADIDVATVFMADGPDRQIAIDHIGAELAGLDPGSHNECRCNPANAVNGKCRTCGGMVSG